MNERTSKEIALKLIEAVSADDVRRVMQDQAYRAWFDDENNWHPYGDQENNWGAANNQQSDPVGALLEIIINGTDAVLMKKHRECQEDTQPQDMYEAVRGFFGVQEGRISNLEVRELGQLADQVVQVGIKRAKGSPQFPTYTVIDFGEGQEPEDFPNTFLSIGKGNKNKISFVQGQYNQGSLGCIPHCTEGKTRLGGYKLILSKKSDKWGWTLIKIKPPNAKLNERNHVVVYFRLQGKHIPCFKQNTIDAFNLPKVPSVGKVKQGTIVKLYQYSIGKGGYAKERGLRDMLAKNLITSPLPFWIYDFDVQPQPHHTSGLRHQGIYRVTFSGLKNMLTSETYQQDDISKMIYLGGEKNEEIGEIHIEAYVRSKMPDYVTRGVKKVVFYTKNGQTHSYETAGILNRVNLGELDGHIVVNVICDALSKDLNVFMSDRERMKSGPDAQKIKEIVLENLSTSKTLKELHTKIASLKGEDMERDPEHLRKLWMNLHSDLFRPGADFPSPLPPPPPPPYEGKEFPTFIDLNRKSDAYKKIPINLSRRIVFKCDAVNDYLTRNSQAGKPYFSSKSERNGDGKISYESRELRDGLITLLLSKNHRTKVGDVDECEFGFTDVSRALPLTRDFKVEFTKKEPPPLPPPVPPPPAGAELPEIRWMTIGDTQCENEETGAHVSEADNLIIRVNRDNKYLKQVKKKYKDSPEIETIFKLGMAALTLAIYEKTKKDPDSDETYKKASSALARSIVQVIKHTSSLKK